MDMLEYQHDLSKAHADLGRLHCWSILVEEQESVELTLARLDLGGPDTRTMRTVHQAHKTEKKSET